MLKKSDYIEIDSLPRVDDRNKVRYMLVFKKLDELPLIVDNQVLENNTNLFYTKKETDKILDDNYVKLDGTSTLTGYLYMGDFNIITKYAVNPDELVVLKQFEEYLDGGYEVNPNWNMFDGFKTMI